MTTLQNGELDARLPTHTLLSLAAFSIDLRYVYGNEQFTKLTGLHPQQLPGRSWVDLFPHTPADDQALIRNVAGGDQISAVIELPVSQPHRRRRDHRTKPGHGTAAGTIPATIYQITPPVGQAAMGVIARRPRNPGVRCDDGREPVDVTTTGEAVRRIEQVLMHKAHRGGKLALLSADLGPGSRPPSTGAVETDPAHQLISQLLARFRADDQLMLINNRWVLLVCPDVEQLPAALLHERLRAVQRLWRQTTAPAGTPFADTRMALGDDRDDPADLIPSLMPSQSGV